MELFAFIRRPDFRQVLDVGLTPGYYLFLFMANNFVSSFFFLTVVNKERLLMRYPVRCASLFNTPDDPFSVSDKYLLNFSNKYKTGRNLLKVLNTFYLLLYCVAYSLYNIYITSRWHMRWYASVACYVLMKISMIHCQQTYTVATVHFL